MAHNRLSKLLNESQLLVEEIKREQEQQDFEKTLKACQADHMAIYKSRRWYPRFVVWELTLACNLRCAHCGSTAGKGRSDELTLDQMFKLSDEMGALGTERLTLLGGEPLIYPYWPEVTKRLQQNNIRVNVITNGWTLPDPGVCDKIKDAGLTIVGISLDGLKKSHDTLRREGSYDRIMSGLDNLKERDLSVAICTVITTNSIKDLEGLYQLLVEKSVKVWQLQIASPLGRLEKDDPLIIKPAQIKELYDFFNEKRKAGGPIHIDLADDVGYFAPFEDGHCRTTRKSPRPWEGCFAGIQVMGIDSNGDIKGCQSLPSVPEYIEGNVTKSSLLDIWNNPEAFKYNRQFKLENLSGQCRDCEFGALCKAGCSSSAISHTGDIGNNPMCIHRA
ncbi:MAG: radical SAM protein [Spirochaetales bacterium]|nr:radical SAM protein [Spirochaetales bacterium]